MPAPGELVLAEDWAALRGQVRAHLAAEQPELAFQVASASLTQARVDGDARGEATALLLQATVLASVQDLDPQDCIDAAQAALQAAQKIGDAEGTLEALRLLGSMQSKLRHHTAALQTAREVLIHCERGVLGAEALARAHLAVSEACLACGAHSEAVQMARKAASHYEELGSTAGRARCELLLAKIHLQLEERDTSIHAATKARKLCQEDRDLAGEAAAVHALALAHAAASDHVETLRAAEAASRLFREAGDLGAEAEALVMAASAKVSICEGRRSDAVGYATYTSILKSAETALAAVRARRPQDRACIGAALYVYSRALLKTKATKGAWVAAKGAARALRKAGDNLGRARAMLVWASADFALGYLEEARANAMAAMPIFEKAGDTEGAAEAFRLAEEFGSAMGLLTQAELEEQRRQELMMQHEMVTRHVQFQAPAEAQAMPVALQKAQEEHHLATQSAAFRRDGASPLDMSKGLDPEVIRGKIHELAAQIIGDSEGLDIDLPLMEAGLTSNTAVILRDELSKDLPGVKLPPTLIFDYPSIGAITEFVLGASR